MKVITLVGITTKRLTPIYYLPVKPKSNKLKTEKMLWNRNQYILQQIDFLDITFHAFYYYYNPVKVLDNFPCINQNP